MALNQQHRILSITIPGVPENAVALLKMTGEEALSEPFKYELAVMASDTIDFSRMIGKPLSFALNVSDQVQHFHGVIDSTSFVKALANQQSLHCLTVIPAFALLRYAQDCRIFQNKSVPDIVRQLLQEFSISPVEWKLTDTYAPLTYCVQYNESPFNFISRLLEQEGIYYYFRHEQNHHVMVISDSAMGYRHYQKDCRYRIDPRDQAYFYRWQRTASYVPADIVQQAYDFKSSHPLPNQKITAKQTPFAHRQASPSYQFTPHELTPAQVQRKAQIASQARCVDRDTIAAAGTYPGLMPGMAFHLSECDLDSDCGNYLITRLVHSAEDRSYQSLCDEHTYTSPHVIPDWIVDDTPLLDPEIKQHFSERMSQRYHICVQGIPQQIIYRPKLLTPKPKTNGAQPAVVVGPKGQEVYTDKFGRVKVHFIWDRRGKYTQEDSCWIRVLQPWAGSGHGMLFIPRVGDEVLVDFEDGDPDRPLVISSLYNATNRPAFDVGSDPTQSGFRTHTIDGDAGEGNQLLFRDLVGKEQVTLKAQRDLHEHVNADRQVTIENNHQRQVDGDVIAQVLKGEYQLSAGEEITITTGPSRMRLHPGGIELDAPLITFNSGVTQGPALEPKPMALDKVTMPAVAGKKSDLKSFHQQQQQMDQQHWVELGLQFLDAPSTPYAHMPYTFKDSQGKQHKGHLDEHGKARIEHLPAGNITGQFGNPQQTQQQLKQLREQLRTHLHELVEEEKRYTQDERHYQQHSQHLPLLKRIEKTAQFAARDTADAFEALLSSAWHSLAGSLHAAVSATEQLLPYVAGIQQALTGNWQQAYQFIHQGVKNTEQDLKPIYLASMVLHDKQSRDIIEHALKQMLHYRSPRLDAVALATLVGKLLPAIVLILITRNPAAATEMFGYIPSGLRTAGETMQQLGRLLVKARAEHKIGGDTDGLIISDIDTSLGDQATQHPLDGWSIGQVVKYADELGLKTNQDELILWSGLGRGDQGKLIAEQYALRNGGVTLEMTPGGKWLDDLNLFSGDSPFTRSESHMIWLKVSTLMIRQASGQVRSLIGTVRPTSIYREEVGELLMNKNVLGLDELNLKPKYRFGKDA